MYHRDFVDGLIVLRVKNLKNVLRFARFYAEKFSKKINLYASGDKIYFVFRRKIIGKVVGISLVAKSTRLSRNREITYFPYRDRIILDEERRKGGWNVRVFRLEEDPVYDFSRKEILSLRNGTKNKFDIIGLVNVHDVDDIVDYAFLAKDPLIILDEQKFFLTGLLSRMFSSIDPKVFLLVTEANVDVKGFKFVDVTREKKFVKKISLDTFRYVPIISVKEILIYE
ncbi:MAG: hypothetical protein Q6363_005370 [Candidatus Njordarchaeota archaeon]